MLEKVAMEHVFQEVLGQDLVFLEVVRDPPQIQWMRKKMEERELLVLDPLQWEDLEILQHQEEEQEQEVSLLLYVKGHCLDLEVLEQMVLIQSLRVELRVVHQEVDQ
jgi:hypothetical protein